MHRISFFRLDTNVPEYYSLDEVLSLSYTSQHWEYFTKLKESTRDLHSNVRMATLGVTTFNKAYVVATLAVPHFHLNVVPLLLFDQTGQNEHTRMLQTCNYTYVYWISHKNF